jgi:DNA-binding transcriptional MerR regulator
MDATIRAVVPVEFDETHERVENAPLGGFMFIGELAVETGIDPKTIRFYEREGLLSPPRHGRFRTYMDTDVRRLKDVLTMRRLGIGIAQIRQLLEKNVEIMNSGHTVNLLLNHLETLRSRQSEIEKQLAETAAILLNCSKEKKLSVTVAIAAACGYLPTDFIGQYFSFSALVS